jgi:transcriptional regulator with XRE-family HTH domain
MPQETAKEFGERLSLAVEAYPSAPPTPHGRLSWLQRELEKHAGVKVSVNTVHKWMHGLSKPRDDNLRALARLLKVDEVWLTLGRQPTNATRPPEATVHQARGAALVVAGLIEMRGGRFSFPAEAKGGPDLVVNLGPAQFGIQVVTPQQTGKTLAFLVREPVGDACILGVLPDEPCPDGGMRLDMIDLTKAGRQSLGGYSIVELETRPGGRFRAQGVPRLLTPIKSLDELATAQEETRQ